MIPLNHVSVYGREMISDKNKEVIFFIKLGINEFGLVYIFRKIEKGDEPK
jgi:hypothetical protein